jgi:hypothetical protein
VTAVTPFFVGTKEASFVMDEIIATIIGLLAVGLMVCRFYVAYKANTFGCGFRGLPGDQAGNEVTAHTAEERSAGKGGDRNVEDVSGLGVALNSSDT